MANRKQNPKKEVEPGTAKKPKLGESDCTVWFKLETKKEEILMFNENETIGNLIPSSNTYEWLISHGGEQLHPYTLLEKVYMNTTRDNPINIRRCLVWVSEDGSTPQPKSYRYLDELQDLYNNEHYLVSFNGTIQMGNRMVSDFNTTRDNPINIRRRVVWVSEDGSTPRPKSYRYSERLQDLYNNEHYLVSFNGTIQMGNRMVSDFNTTRDNPINIRRRVVWVSEDGSTPRPKSYRYSERLQDLYNNERYLVSFNGTIQMGDRMVSDFATDVHNPLCVRKRSRYIKLPEGISINLAQCETAQDLIDEANTKDKYIVRLDGEPVLPGDVRLNIAIMKGEMVTMLKKKDGICDFSLSTSASACTATASTRQKLIAKTKQHELYTNWFAMSLYDCVEYTEDSLNLAKTVQQILKFNLCTQLRLNKNEEVYTSLLSTAFDCFIQKSGHCCLHRCPIYNGSIPDFYMASLNEGLPQHPKLIADFKIKNFEDAEVQSFHYCMAMVDRTDSNYPILTMPCTSEKFDMRLCIPESQAQMAYIKIMEAKVDNTEDLALFFCRMRLAVQDLQPDMFDKKYFAIMPTPELTFKDEENLNRNRVFKHNMRVYKFYDGETFGSPNLGLIKVLGDDYLGSLQEVYLTKDIRMFSYDYHLVNENRQSHPTLKCFKPIIEALDTLHSNGIVHSDVRPQNMLFLENGDAKIIDFDLANYVDTNYPANYNGNFAYRHKGATAGKPRKIVHDRYSLFRILEMKVSLTRKQEKHISTLKTNENPMASIFDNGQN